MQKTLKMNHKYLIITLVLIGSITITTSYADSEPIPSWIKNTALWYGQDTITDDEFFSMIEFLIDREIITVSNDDNQKTSQLESELSSLKSKTVRDIQNAYDDGYQDGLKDRPKNMINENNHPDIEISNNVKVTNNGINDIVILRNNDADEFNHTVGMSFDGIDDDYVKPLYRIGETLTVEVDGWNTKIDSGTQISFIVTSLSTNDIVALAQAEVDESGYAFFIIELGGELMPPYADYEVVATYGDLKERTAFHLVK